MGALTLLSLFGIALATGRGARVSPAVAFFLAVAFTVLVLYAGALAGALWWTALAVHLGGLALLAVEGLRFARQRTAPSIPVSIGVLVLLCSWFWAVHGRDQYMLFDEFAHWGIFLRDMLALDGLWTADTNSMHPRYPPGASLWQYLFNALAPASEGKAYLAHFVLTYRLLPLLEASAPARIVNVSSMGQTPIDFDDVMMEHSYNPGDAYRRSKLAQIMFTIDLAAQLDPAKVTVTALHPARSMNTARVINGGFQPLSTVEEGAEATMQAAVSPEVKGVTGVYFNQLKEARANAQAYDEAARKKLWDLSMKLTGLA
jgi:NAD(P)-dependent dehydrogenase (short-subunit alcohol dehydrogenase family)